MLRIAVVVIRFLDYKQLMKEVEKKKDMNKWISRLNEQISHLLCGFEGCYYKGDKSIPIFETEEWRNRLKRIICEHYELL